MADIAQTYSNIFSSLKTTVFWLQITTFPEACFYGFNRQIDSFGSRTSFVPETRRVITSANVPFMTPCHMTTRMSMSEQIYVYDIVL